MRTNILRKTIEGRCSTVTTKGNYRLYFPAVNNPRCVWQTRGRTTYRNHGKPFVRALRAPVAA